MPVLNISTYGQLMYCTTCKLYHLEFKNLFFDFSSEDLTIFKNYILSIQGEYYNHINHHTVNRRKIILPTRLKGFKFCFTLEELNDLKKLLDADISRLFDKGTVRDGFHFSLN